MPKSRFVPSSRLLPLIVYFAVAFVVLLFADALLQEMGSTRVGRQALILGWFVLFPVGGWMVWRRG